jgi:hypothetical protein
MHGFDVQCLFAIPTLRILTSVLRAFVHAGRNDLD